MRPLLPHLLHNLLQGDGKGAEGDLREDLVRLKVPTKDQTKKVKIKLPNSKKLPKTS